MSPELAEYFPIIIGAVIAALIAVLVVLRLNRRARVISDETSSKDVLDEGAERARRNQALIDAPKAVENTIGTQSANANSDTIAAAGALADAEAGASVAPTVGDPLPPAPVEEAASTPADDLTRIKGLGPKLATMLAEQGITTFAQIAAWSDSDVERIDATLGRFAGRITRDQWVEQAKLLESGDESGFSQKFGQT